MDVYIDTDTNVDIDIDTDIVLAGGNLLSLLRVGFTQCCSGLCWKH